MTTMTKDQESAQDRLVANLKRAGLSDDQSGYEEDQLERASLAEPGLSQAALRRFILKGAKPSKPLGGQPKGKMSMADAAQKILEDAGEPLHSSEITKRALRRKLITSGGKTPEATMGAVLAVAAKKKDGAFLRTAPGTFGLMGRDKPMRKKKAAAKKKGA